MESEVAADFVPADPGIVASERLEGIAAHGLLSAAGATAVRSPGA
jgi:hypothetical protein